MLANCPAGGLIKATPVGNLQQKFCKSKKDAFYIFLVFLIFLIVHND